MGNPLLESNKAKRGRPPGVAPRVTIAQVAEALQVPVQTVYTWTRQLCRDGKPALPTKKFGRFVRVLVSDVEKLPERLQVRKVSARAVSFFSGCEAQSSTEEVVK